MKEPVFYNRLTGDEVPFSRASSTELSRVAIVPVTPGHVIDEAFHRQYAAILLKERGQ